MADIKDLRIKINNLDAELINLLAERRKLSQQVVKVKDVKGSAIRDQERESELLQRILTLGKEKGVDPHFLSKVFYEIIEDSVRLQQTQKKSGR